MKNLVRVLVLGGWLCALAPAHAEFPAGVTLTPSAEVTVRVEDGRTNLPPDSASSWLKSMWYGGELKNGTFFEYSARVGLSGQLSPEVTYGLRALFRNFKQPAFTFPAPEPGYGNSAMVADLFYIGVAPFGDRALLLLGKAPMPWLKNSQLFWDNDVNPVGASEVFKHAFSSGAAKQKVSLVLAQWLPLSTLRNGPTSVMFAEQVAYAAEWPRLQLLTAAGLIKLDGFDRFVQNANTGGATTVKSTSTGGVTTVPKLDYAPENDPGIVGHNPLWLDLMATATLPQIASRPLAFKVDYLHNFDAGGEAPSTYRGPNRNAYSAGLSYGKADRSKPLSWSVGYDYQLKGVASVVNGWTDDAFGSDLKGHVVSAELVPFQRASVSLVYRNLASADGRDRSGNPLPAALSSARYQNIRLAFGVGF